MSTGLRLAMLGHAMGLGIPHKVDVLPGIYAEPDRAQLDPLPSCRLTTGNVRMPASTMYFHEWPQDSGGGLCVPSELRRHLSCCSGTKSRSASFQIF